MSSRTRAIMAVDVFGHPVEWDALSASAERHALSLIDDSCEALGAEYRGRRIGGFGAAAAFAFYPNKQMRPARAGHRDARRSARRPRAVPRAAPGSSTSCSAYNYRMDELSAALGISQLKRIEACLVRRERVAARYSALLRGFGWLDTPVVRLHVRMSWFVYVVRLAEGVDRARVVLAMEAQCVPARAYFPPMHLQPYVRERLGTGPGMLPVTEALARRTLALSFHNHLSEAEIEPWSSGLERAYGGSR